jgi:hypothetical protein
VIDIRCRKRYDRRYRLHSTHFWRRLVGGLFPGKPVFITYSYDVAPADYYVDYFSVNFLAFFEPFTFDEYISTEIALSQWDDASGITFLEVPSGQGDIRFGKYDLTLHSSSATVFGFAYFPVEEGGGTDIVEWDLGGDVFISTSWDYEFSSSIFASTVLHEIGHAVGLKHPHEGDPILEPIFDSTLNTVMSYSGSLSFLLRVLDFDAVEYLYGLDAQDGTQVATWNWDPCVYQLLDSRVSVMQSSKNRMRIDRANTLDGPMYRRILCQRSVRPGGIVVRGIG